MRDLASPGSLVTVSPFEKAYGTSLGGSKNAECESNNSKEALYAHLGRRYPPVYFIQIEGE